MRRGIATTWHALSVLIVSVLFFVFVLPRWGELSGAYGSAVGSSMRVVTGALLLLTALPVWFNLRLARRPDSGTPRLALTLRVCSVLGQLLAGVVITGVAVAEIWLPLDEYGHWLFAIYAGAAVLALIGAAAFYLAFAAELPPPPPKPIDPGAYLPRADGASEDDGDDDADDTEVAETSAADDDGDHEITESSAAEPFAAEPDREPAQVGLRNRRGKRS